MTEPDDAKKTTPDVGPNGTARLEPLATPAAATAPNPAATAPIPAASSTRPEPGHTGETERLEPLPAGQPDGASRSSSSHASSAPFAPKPRKKSRKALIIWSSIALILVLLVVAFFVADRLVRDYANNYIRDTVVDALALPDGDGVSVDLGDGILLTQVIVGTINNASVSVDRLEVGPLAGSAIVTASDIPLDSSSAVSTLDIEFTVPETDLESLATELSRTQLGGIELDSVTLEEPDVRIATSIPILGFELPIAVSLDPGAADGELVFTPTSIELNGQILTAEEIRDGLFGGVAGPLLDTQSVCIASQLPEALTLSDVVVDNKDLVLTLDGAGAVLNSTTLSVKGTCPS